MIGLNFTFTDDTAKVQAAANLAANRAIGKTAFAIRSDVIESIQPGEGPSAPGTPPHTHTQKKIKRGKNAGKTRLGNLQRAIAYSHDKAAKRAVVGPRFSVVGTSGSAHEFGGEFKGDKYPPRPFMGPGLDRNLSTFSSSLGGSLGG